MASSNRSLALLSSILHTPTPLPSVHALRVTYSKVGPAQSAVRRFLRLKLPIVQYHNPHIAVQLDQHKQQTVRAQIEVTTGQRSLALTAPRCLCHLGSRGLHPAAHLPACVLLRCPLSAHGSVTLFPADIGVDSDVLDALVQVARADSADALHSAAERSHRKAQPTAPPPPTSAPPQAARV